MQEHKRDPLFAIGNPHYSSLVGGLT